VRKLILFLAAVSLVLFAEKALCYETAFSIEPESFNSFGYQEMREQKAAPLSIRTGRFLSVDPEMDLAKMMTNPQIWNRYTYVLSNPLRYTDPDGREHVQEPGFTKPLSAATGWADEPAVACAFYAQGLLFSETAMSVATDWAVAGLARVAGRLIARVATVDDAARAARGAYEVAVEGGKHAGTIENYAGRTAAQIAKAVRSYEGQVAEHAAKLKNPARYVRDWSKLSSEAQRGLLKKWTKDMYRNAELAAVLRGMLERFGQ
jgi:hypothetical protein